MILFVTAHLILAVLAFSSTLVASAADPHTTKNCVLHPLGPGRDDTDQVEQINALRHYPK